MQFHLVFLPFFCAARIFIASEPGNYSLDLACSSGFGGVFQSKAVSVFRSRGAWQHLHSSCSTANCDRTAADGSLIADCVLCRAQASATQFYFFPVQGCISFHSFPTLKNSIICHVQGTLLVLHRLPVLAHVRRTLLVLHRLPVLAHVQACVLLYEKVYPVLCMLLVTGTFPFLMKCVHLWYCSHQKLLIHTNF